MVWMFLNKLKIELPYNPEISFLDIYLKRKKHSPLLIASHLRQVFLLPEIGHQSQLVETLLTGILLLNPFLMFDPIKQLKLIICKTMNLNNFMFWNTLFIERGLTPYPSFLKCLSSSKKPLPNRYVKGNHISFYS